MRLAERLTALDLETVRLEVSEGAVLTVTIDRPQVLNALSPLVIAELRQVVEALHDGLGAEIADAARAGTGVDTGTGAPAGASEPDWSIRGVILTGAGEKSFVAGADIAAMREQTRDEARTYTAAGQDLTRRIETLPVPVIAAVNGFALGGGCELAMACDYIFASEQASFGQPEVALGLIPGFGGCVRLQQHVGIAAARELIFTGRRIAADEALRLGLVQRVLPDTEALLAAAHESLALSSKQSPAAVAAAKRTIRATQSQPTDAGLDVEREVFVARFGTADMVEGTTAFVEKRRAQFVGR